jgi:anthranilate phosphoribosyltransferase
MPPAAQVPSVPPSPLQLALDQLARGGELTEAATEAAVREMVGGTADPATIAALLVALRDKGESEAEVAGAVRALRGAMRQVEHPEPDTLVDTCGTGGGAVTTVNLSTAAAFVAAGAGVRIAKHGNRSFTSRSGSADVLESLGISLEVGPEHAAQVLADVGVVFLFAPNYHPAMRHVAPVRRTLGTATLMNLVGPLANPANARRQVVGVGDPARAAAVAGALARLGAIHALVVHAEVGMDEFSPVGETAIWEVRGGTVREWQFDPSQTPAAAASLAGLEGGEPADNAAQILSLLEAPARAGAALRGAVILNAAAAIYVAGLAPSLVAGIDAAIASLDSGRARERLEALRRAAPR